GSSLVTNAGIDDPVAEVNEQVDGHEDAGGDDDDGLHQRVVASQHGFEREQADPRIIVDELHDYGAPEQVTDLRAEQGEQRQKAVLERVLPEDQASRNPARAKRLDHVHLENLDHGGPAHARDDRDQPDRQ